MTRTLPGLFVGTFTLLALTGCGEERGTAECAKLPLYDVRDGGLDPALERQLVEQGCITAPVPPGRDAGGD